MSEMKPNALVIIPSRLGSTRLPDKPLADIHGEAMIVHVWRRAVEAGIGAMWSSPAIIPPSRRSSKRPAAARC